MQSRFLLFSFCVIFSINGYSQFIGDFEILAGTTGTVASEEFQPLWLVANKWGTIADKQADLSTRFRIANTHNFGRYLSRLEHEKFDDRETTFRIDFAIDVYNNNGFRDTFIQEAFLKASYKNWAIAGGRFEQTVGEVHPELSSGSLGGISKNALPIPKITAFNTDFIDIPFTNGWLQFKGMFSHGWLGDERLLQKAFLHEKSLYGRIGKRKLKVYGGVQHYGIWGGQNSKYQLDRSFKGFLDVVFFKEADDGSVGPNIRPNRAGYQRGSADLGITYTNVDYKFHLYHQTPIENHTSITFKNKDRLVGFTIDRLDKLKFWQSLLFEFLYTKQMSNYPGNKEAYYYYENGIYQTGWDYMGRVIGSPLIINRTRGNKYFDAMEPPFWNGEKSYPLNYNMPGNRVVAVHFGALFKPARNLRARTLITYSRNYGNGDSVAFFAPHKTQWYTLQELIYNLDQKLEMSASIAYDFGEINDNFGGSLSVSYKIK